MKKLLAVAVALALWSGSGGAANIAWTRIGGPGGGGNWPTVDVSSTGAVALGGDVSGLYIKASGGSWGMRGRTDGITATNILQARWCPTNPAVLLVGTTNSLYVSTNSGTSFSKVFSGSSWSGDANGNASSGSISAVAWYRASGATDTVGAIAVWRDKGKLWFSKGTGSNNASLTWSNPPTSISGAGFYPTDSSTTITRLPIKALFDPSATAGHSEIYVLMGTGGGGDGNVQEIWKSTDTNNTTWSRVAPTGSTHLHALDFAFSDVSNNRKALVTFDRESKSNWPTEGFHKAAVMRTSMAGSWEVADTTSDVRGAVSYSSPYWYVSNVRDDACPTIPANAGVWRTHRAYDSLTVFLRHNEGANWDGFWGDCPNARGQTISNSANSVSADGQYWIGAMNVWKKNSNGELKRESTVSSGGTWQSSGIDNVNNAMLCVDGSTLYAGYYDIGLWSTSADGSAGWTDCNSSDADWAGGDGLGGNVNGMVVVGSTRYVIDAPSSKGNIDDPTKEGYEYRLWKSVSGGSWTKLSYQPGWINNATNHKNHAYMRGLCYDGTHLYVASNGVVYRDSTGSVDYPWQACPTNLTDKDAPLTNPTAPIYTLAAQNGLVLAGGPTGIYRSVNSGGTWTRVCTLGSIAVHCPGDTVGRGGESNGHLHSEAWNGIHSFIPLTNDSWLAVSYIDNDTTYDGVHGCMASFDSTGWGLFLSTNAGQSWTRIGYGTKYGDSHYERELRAVATSDTCDDVHRIMVTSGEAFSSGSNSTGPFTACKGAELLWLSGSTVLGRQDFGAGTTNYPRYEVGACVTTNSDGDFLETAPGFGVMLGTTNHFDECQTTRPKAAGRPHEELTAAEILARRTVFSLTEALALVRAGQLEIFDVSGRRSTRPAPGVYFSVKRDKAGAIVSRRTVLVTR